jgi:hypothetical protein
LVTIFNETGLMGIMIGKASTDIFGSLVITFLSVILILFLLMLVFKIPMEYSLIFILPLLIVLMAYDSTFRIIGGIIIFILAMFLTIIWFLNKT